MKRDWRCRKSRLELCVVECWQIDLQKRTFCRGSAAFAIRRWPSPLMAWLRVRSDRLPVPTCSQLADQRTSGAIDSFRTMATLSGLETAYAAVLAGVPLDMSTGQPVNIAIQLDGACGPATYSQRLERIWDWCIAGFGMAQVSSQGPRPPNAPRAFAASSPPSPVLPRRDTNSPISGF